MYYSALMGPSQISKLFVPFTLTDAAPRLFTSENMVAVIYKMTC